MLDYLSRFGDVPFSHSPMNDVDLLIFAQLAYMDFAAVDETPCSFTYALAHASFADSPDPSEDRFSFQKKDDLQLASLAASCPRYQDILFAGFTRHFDPQAETQFAALSLLLDEENLLIAFRGTDNTLAGWKEDFNMAFMDEIPAQHMAREYLECMEANTPAVRRITVAGHSKGGNLALYSASVCHPAVQDKIALAVSFDGPGLNGRVIGSEGFARMKGRMRAVLPRSSLVGLLFEQPPDTRIVSSRVFSILQHYPYFWKTKEMDFLYAASHSKTGALLGSSLMGLMEKLPPEAREQLIEAVYDIIASSEADTFNGMAARWLQNAAAIAARLFRTDAETRRLFLTAITAFLASAAQALDALIRE